MRNIKATDFRQQNSMADCMNAFKKSIKKQRIYELFSNIRVEWRIKSITAQQVLPVEKHTDPWATPLARPASTTLSHGLLEQSLKDVFQATVVGKLLYCAPAWSGFCSAADCTRLNSFLRRCDKLGYTETNYVDISTMFQTADDALLRTILSNRSHVLYRYLFKRPEIAYSLRTTNHNKFLIPKTSDLGDRHFIIWSFDKNLYWCDSRCNCGIRTQKPEVEIWRPKNI